MDATLKQVTPEHLANPWIILCIILIATYMLYSRDKSCVSKLPTIATHRGIKIKIARTTQECVTGITELLSSNPCILGLDCEWKPYFNQDGYNKISLLQLSNNKICLLIRLHLIDTIPACLVNILINPQIVKVGLNIAFDAKKLYKDYNLQVYGCVDIKHFIFEKCVFGENDHETNRTNMNTSQKAHVQFLQNVRFSKLDELSRLLLNNSDSHHDTITTSDSETNCDIKTTNVRNICSNNNGNVNNYSIDFVKDKHVTMSNWEIIKLTKEQIDYAAKDAIYGYYSFIQCVLNMDNKELSFDWINKNNYNITDIDADCNYAYHEPAIISNELLDNYFNNPNFDIVKICYGIMDISSIKNKNKTNCKSKTESSSNINLSKKSCNKKGKKDGSSNNDGHWISKPWNNGVILRKNGTVLTARCSYRTMKNYIKRGIAIQINENTIQFKDELTMPIERQQQYGRIPKQQKCVVCGNDKKLRRYYIIPQCYIKSFEMKLKLENAEKIASNIVLLCLNCCDCAIINENEFRNKLIKKYCIMQWNKEIMIDEKNQDVGIAGMTLQRYFQQLKESQMSQMNENNNGKKIIRKSRKKKRTILPEDRKNELMKLIKDHFGLESIDHVTGEWIDKAADCFVSKKHVNETKRLNNQTHCKELIDAFGNDFEMFCSAWTKNFNEKMKP